MNESTRQFAMVDVGAKPETRRVATAQGRIELSLAAYEALRDRRNPKGDVLAQAEVAGIMAAKRTSELLPLCHPLPIDQVVMTFELEMDTRSVLVLCQVSTTAKTGVEMEALMGVNGALLAIYDLCKAVDPVIRISDVFLRTKEGGKSGTWNHPGHRPATAPAPTLGLQGIRSALLTISDRVSRGESEDRSGPTLRAELERRGARVEWTRVVADDRAAIAEAVRTALRESDAEIVVTTGGTGLSPRDVTPEALEPLFDRKIPGLAELLRSEGARKTRMSWISRTTAGLVGSRLIIALPGSPKACAEAVETLESILPHALEIARGAHHG